MRILFAAFAFLLLQVSCNDAPNATPRGQGSTELKTINYRGGVVRFRLPTDWIEEYDPNGGGTFYRDVANSPTLRLNVLTLESPRPVDANTPSELLRSRAEKTGQDIVRLDGGNAVIAYNESAEENTHHLVIHYWELANAIPPKHGCLAIFSLTTLQSQKSDPEINAVIQSLDREIRLCKFSPELGN